MRSLKIILLIFLAMTPNAFSQTPPLEPGVSQALAKWRAAHYSNVRYKLDITLEKGAPLMSGYIEIGVKLTDEGAKNDLVLDWRQTSLENSVPQPYAVIAKINDWTAPGGMESVLKPVSEHLLIPKEFLKPGENTVKISFASPIKTSGAAVTRYIDKEDGAEYVYSLFVPSDASTAFPVFDQPDLKARFTLELRVPKDWKGISNDDYWKKEVFDCNKIPLCETIYYFRETLPISTYLFAFAAGEFAEFGQSSESQYFSAMASNHSKISTYTRRNRSLGQDSIFVRKSQAEKFKQHSKEVFRLNREAVKYLEDYFDYRFPFPKYDLVLLPEFPFGGMEHAGATFLREDRIIFPQEPTANDYITRGNLIFHEAAHQWFGDTVTMRWFDDLWLKEGFAEFMAYKTMEKVLPQYNAWKAFYERNKPLAYLTDASRGTTPVYQEIPNLSAAKSAYGNIVYRKAPSFLRQAEFYLGADKFQTAVRAFLKKHEFSNAEWMDLVKEFETASGQDLKEWASDWVTKRGMFVISIKNYQADVFGFTGRPVIEFKAKHTLDDKTVNPRMKFKVLASSKKSGVEVYDFPLKSKTGNLALKREHHDLIFPNYQDYGYGIFLLDEKSRAYVLADIQNEKDDFLRAMMWGALWDSVREAELNPKDYVELAIKNIATEKDELTIQTILNRTGTAMNYYLSNAQARELAPRLEAVLMERIENAETVGQRITFYRAFLNVASTEKAKSILKNVESGRLRIKGFDLKLKDRYDILTRLAVLGDKDAEEEIYKNASRETNKISDEERRYMYASGAALPSALIKQKYFEKFLNDKIVSESWIEAAFAPFNSPRHADLTLPYLEKALAELPNLKRSRKIFFVNGWLAAFVGGQKSEQALRIVNKFLADNPNLDRDLRLKILENVDGLERSVRIRAKYAQ